jgi:hypothetical protein
VEPLISEPDPGSCSRVLRLGSSSWTRGNSVELHFGFRSDELCDPSDTYQQSCAIVAALQIGHSLIADLLSLIVGNDWF